MELRINRSRPVFLKVNHREISHHSFWPNKFEVIVFLIYRETLPSRALDMLFLSSRWSVNFVYMGLTFNVTNISGDLYLNMFILFLVELPGNYICMKLIDTRLGRRWTVGGSIAIAGISLCLVAVVPKGDLFLSRTNEFFFQFELHVLFINLFNFVIGNHQKKYCNV